MKTTRNAVTLAVGSIFLVACSAAGSGGDPESAGITGGGSFSGSGPSSGNASTGGNGSAGGSGSADGGVGLGSGSSGDGSAGVPPSTIDVPLANFQRNSGGGRGLSINLGVGNAAPKPLLVDTGSAGVRILTADYPGAVFTRTGTIGDRDVRRRDGARR